MMCDVDIHKELLAKTGCYLYGGTTMYQGINGWRRSQIWTPAGWRFIPSPWAQVLCLDWWLHPVPPVHLPVDVNHEAGVWWVWPLHHPPQMLLTDEQVPDIYCSCWFWSISFLWQGHTPHASLVILDEAFEKNVVLEACIWYKHWIVGLVWWFLTLYSGWMIPWYMSNALYIFWFGP